MGLLLGLFAAAALVPSTIFVVSYSRKGWRSSPEGWYLFLQAVLWMLVFASFLLGRVVGGLGLTYWTVLVAGLAAAQWALLLLYRRAQKQVRRGDVCPTCGGALLTHPGANGKH